jgi:hypothetical protein
MVIRLGDGCSAKRIGFDNIRTRFKILAVNILYDIGSCNGQNIIIALQRMLMILETLTSIDSLFMIYFPESPA